MASRLLTPWPARGIRGVSPISALVGLMLAICAAPTAAQTPWSFSENIRLNTFTERTCLDPAISIGPGGEIGVVWTEEVPGTGTHIFFTSSGDGGQTWDPPEQVDSRTTGSFCRFPSLAWAPSSFPVVVWEDDRYGENIILVFFAKRDPASGGNPWTSNTQISFYAPGGTVLDYLYGCVAALDTQRFFITYAASYTAPYEHVYIRASRDAGNTWEEEVRVSDDAGINPTSGASCLVVDPDSSPTPGEEILYCALTDWRGEGQRWPNVRFHRSVDGGQSWTIGVQVNDITEEYQTINGRGMVRLSTGTLLIGWWNSWPVGEARACSSLDGGVSWSPSTAIASPASTEPSMAVYDDLAFATFTIRDTDLNQAFRVSDPGGLTWTEDIVRIDDDDTGAAAQSGTIAAGGADLVYCTFEDNRETTTARDVLFSRGTRDVVGIPSVTSTGVRGLLAAIPNPSSIHEIVRIPVRGSMSGDRMGSAAVYGPSGRWIRNLPVLRDRVIWDGRDRGGHLVPPGVYWVVSPRIAGSGRGSARIVRVDR